MWADLLVDLSSRTIAYLRPQRGLTTSAVLGAAGLWRSCAEQLTRPSNTLAHTIAVQQSSECLGLLV